jgi:hypothetical protein
MDDWKESSINERVERLDNEGVGKTQLKRVVMTDNHEWAQRRVHKWTIQRQHNTTTLVKAELSKIPKFEGP